MGWEREKQLWVNVRHRKEGGRHKKGEMEGKGRKENFWGRKASDRLLLI